MGLMHDFIILASILSAPVDFLESIEDTILLISEPDTGLKENLGVFVGRFCFYFLDTGVFFYVVNVAIFAYISGHIGKERIEDCENFSLIRDHFLSLAQNDL